MTIWANSGSAEANRSRANISPKPCNTGGWTGSTGSRTGVVSRSDKKAAESVQGSRLHFEMQFCRQLVYGVVNPPGNFDTESFCEGTRFLDINTAAANHICYLDV